MSQAVAQAKQKPAAGGAKALSTTRRIWEVDAWRGIAITTMVIYHLVYDLWRFAGVNVNLQDGFWFYFQRFTATSFILLVGISLVLSYQQARRKRGRTEGLYWKFFQRGLRLFGFGLIITLVVRLAVGSRVDYGILHFIGTAVAISYPFLRLRWLNLAIAALLFAVSYAIAGITVDTYALVWLGLEPPRYTYVDYFPLLHWFPVVLIGIFIGNTLYTGGERQFPLPDFSSFFPINLLQFLGRRSLLIYLIHQPVLAALLVALGVIDLGF